MLKIYSLITLLISLSVSSIAIADSSLCGNYQATFFRVDPTKDVNVCLFDANPLHTKDIQTIVTNIHNYEKEHDGDGFKEEFRSKGYALLFQAGTYPISVPVGYYTQVSGLGLNPDNTTINSIKVDQDDLQNGNSLTNFWRSAENLKVTSDMMWAVSQASPLRRMHITGKLMLALGQNQYASGGFLANSEVDGGIDPSIQQQWMMRNATIGHYWPHQGVNNLNMVFVGVNNQNPSPTWKNFPNMVVDQTPKSLEKPYLVYYLPVGKQQYEFAVVVPSVQTNTSGKNWNDTVFIPQDDFIIVNSWMSSEQINDRIHAAFSHKTKRSSDTKAIIFTPGQYNLDSTINIDHDNTVVMGLGVPVLTAMTPHIPIMITSGSGIKISGLLFEAGSNEPFKKHDPGLLQIGTTIESGYANSPTLLSDIYCRVGGRVVAQTHSCLSVNDSYVIGDNIWLWRADHGAGSGNWYSDQANHGLIVKGHDVTMYGLAVEHFQKNQVDWYGENGAVYFYQSELPYDVPKDPAPGQGFVVHPAFEVKDQVNYFRGYGFGVYDFFRSFEKKSPPPDYHPYALSAIEVPDRGDIAFTRMIGVSFHGSLGNQRSMIRIMPDNKLIGSPSTQNGTQLPCWPSCSK